LRIALKTVDAENLSCEQGLAPGARELLVWAVASVEAALGAVWLAPGASTGYIYPCFLFCSRERRMREKEARVLKGVFQYQV
jgi:hypothetical protein